MSRRLLTRTIAVPILAVLATLVAAAPATQAAAATAGDRLALVTSWTEPPVSSYNSWNSGRLHQANWATYQLDWSTDYCSASPDEPLGFDFRLSCWRHDFGYRNYKALQQFPANKAHVDDAFYADLKRVCAQYNVFIRASCYSLAWTYYQAVRVFGRVIISQADLDHAATLKAQGAAQEADAHAR
jgi:Prokaryotic phospholipase A2